MKRFLLAAAVILAAIAANADNYRDMEPLKLDVPEMKAELAAPAELSLQEDTYTEVSSMVASDMMTSNAWKPDFDFFKSKTNPGVKPYKFMDDMTFVGVPLFIAGWAIKSEKAMFRVNNKDGKKNTQLLTDFKTGIDDYTQFFGPVMTVGLKLGGYEGRSDWPRLLASAAVSYGLMAGLVNGIKYSAKEMRPDGSTANSWPSGHTATSFVGATLLHKEYGLTRSPWFSVAGYGVATATGVMRVLNNRHWVSDVMSGAGIGILSGELGYALCDLLFKGKGLLRNDLQMDYDNPSFFSISMGVGLGGKDVTFTGDDLQNKEYFDALGYEFEGEGDGKIGIDFRSSTVVDAEGAYFFNKYGGVGGRFRVRAMSAKSFNRFVDYANSEKDNAWEAVKLAYEEVGMQLTDEVINKGGAAVSEIGAVVKSDHLAEFTGSAGMYFNIPLSKRLAIGTKFLVGRSITQELDIDGYARGNKKNIDYEMTIKNGIPVSGSLGLPYDAGETYETNWDLLTLGASSSTSLGTGLSLTYRYKSNFSWRLFCDYDYTKKDYTLTLNAYNYLKSGLNESGYGIISLLSPYALMMDPVVFKRDKKMHYVTLGLSFLVNL